MGTRSLVRFYCSSRKSSPLVVFYQQYDGYPHGVGNNLATFLKETKFNDVNCLSAQYCAFNKKGVGFFYIYPIDSEDEEWNYDVIVTGDEISVIVNDGDTMTLDEFKQYCTKITSLWH